VDGLSVYRELILKAFVTTIELTILGSLLAVAFAFLFGLMRVSTHAVVRGTGYVVVEFLRGNALIVQLFWVFYVLPYMGYQLDPLAAGVLVLGLNEGAYGAEIVRSAIVSRPAGQLEACIALGISPTQRLWRIILPQSVPVMLPGFGNIFVDLMKATALVSLVTIQDLTFVTSSIRRATGDTVSLFGALLVLYFLLALLLSAFTRLLERRYALDRTSPRRRLLISPEAGI
jgi:polar amino acid transport system permease protein